MASADQVRRAMDRLGPELERKANVVGMGARAARDGRKGHYDLVVYVDNKVSAANLSEVDLLPSQVTVPGRHGDITIGVQVIEQGKVEPELQGLEEAAAAEPEMFRPEEG